MEAYIYDCSGSKWLLPELLKWDISHGFGSPCDSFELEFVYSADFLPHLSEAVELEAVHDGRTVFYGRVDSFEARCGTAGATVKMAGRGMQALLLDNEAESADYYYPDMDYILARHVKALGLSKIDGDGASGSAVRFNVGNGWSHWKALSSFAEFCCGLRPRFAPDGTLVLNGEAGGRVYRIDGKTAVVSQSYGEDRYGVISHVLMKRRYTNIESRVENADFAALGGRCLRVVNVPKSTGYDAMRHEAEYQIKKSMENYSLARITVADAFPVFPGDRVEMESSPLGLSGKFLVTATRCTGSGKGVCTEIEMKII